jgi:hypothetical protein
MRIGRRTTRHDRRSDVRPAGSGRRAVSTGLRRRSAPSTTSAPTPPTRWRSTGNSRVLGDRLGRGGGPHQPRRGHGSARAPYPCHHGRYRPRLIDSASVGKRRSSRPICPAVSSSCGRRSRCEVRRSRPIGWPRKRRLHPVLRAVPDRLVPRTRARSGPSWACPGSQWPGSPAVARRPSAGASSPLSGRRSSAVASSRWRPPPCWPRHGRVPG